MAVEELRLFVGLYEDVHVVPGSRIARKLEVARKAVAAYEEIESLQSRESA